MARGRKPQAPALKMLKSTDRPCRENAEAPEYDLLGEFPEAPLHLDTDGREMWDDLGPKLVNARVLQVVDLYGLEQLCFAWQCLRKKAKAGMEATAAEHTALKSLFSEYGLTPASRSKITAGGAPPKENKFSGNGKKA